MVLSPHGCLLETDGLVSRPLHKTVGGTYTSYDNNVSIMCVTSEPPRARAPSAELCDIAADNDY